MNDEATYAILKELNAARTLTRGTRELMFKWDANADVITIRGALSNEYVIRFPAIRLCKELNTLRVPITKALVVNTLGDFYDHPGDRGIEKLPS